MKRYVADFISDSDKDSRIRKVLEPILAECGGSGFDSCCVHDLCYGDG